VRESLVEKHLVARVKQLGGLQRKVAWIGRKGAPDRMILLPEHAPWFPGLTWVELKAPGLRAEDNQAREHDRLRAFGQRVVVLDTKEAIDAFLFRGVMP